MGKISIEQTLKLIPEFFEINLNLDKDGNVIFRKLSKILAFDEAFIYFLIALCKHNQVNEFNQIDA